MSTGYKTYLQTTGPSWQQAPNAAAFVGALGTELDTVLGWYKAGIKAQFPGLAGAAADDLALTYLGDEIGLPRNNTESSATYGERLRTAWTIWPWAGSPVGLLLALYQAGFSTPVITQVNGLAYQINSTPTASQIEALATATSLPSWTTRTVLPNANPRIPASTDGRPVITALTIPWWTLGAPMDGAGNQWTSRFSVLFPVTVTDPALGTAANLARIRSVIKEFRPAKAGCAGIWVCTAGKFVGWPTRSVNDGSTVGAVAGGSVVTYYAGA